MGELPELGQGMVVVVYLHDPKEKNWGLLLKMEPYGLWLKGIALASVEDWARELAADGPNTMGLSTFFVPFLRVEKIVADERAGAVPSLSERFEALTGRSALAVLSGME